MATDNHGNFARAISHRTRTSAASRRSSARRSTSSSPRTSLPAIYNAVKIDAEHKGVKINLTGEVQQHLGGGRVRCVALGSTDGLVRGMECVDTGAPVTVPVGKETLGRVFNLLGEPIDGRGPVDADERWPIHRDPPPLDRPLDQDRAVRDRHQGHRPAHAVRPRRQGRPVRRCRPGQDGHPHRADRPHRQRPRRLLGVRRRRRANPRRDRPLARNAGSQDRRHRPQRHRADLHGLRPDERAARSPSPRRPLGPDDGRVLPRRDRRRHAALHRQHLPLLAGGQRSVGPAGPHAVAPSVTSRRWPPRWVRLQERIASTKKGAITSVQAVYVPADDPTDPAPATAFGQLDAFLYLERSISEKGIYPAVDPLASSSRILDPQYVGERHYDVARRVQTHPAAVPRTARHHRHPRRRRTERRRQAGRAPGPPHRAVPVAAVPRGRSVHRQAGRDHAAAPTRSAASRKSATASGTTCPKQAFMYVGAIEQAEEQAKKMAAKA